MNGGPNLSYEFVSPQCIIFGWGRRREVGGLAKTLGRRAFIVCGARALVDGGIVEEISGSLRQEGITSALTETISHEPEVDDVDRLAASLRAQGAGHQGLNALPSRATGG